jgi:hypothetical protein
MALLALWLTYAAAAAGVLWLARRYGGGLSRGMSLLLALLPLVFTGRAMLTGGVYGPADLYYGVAPWKNLPQAAAFSPPKNAILSDLAFANLPWRAALRDAVANGRAPLWNRFVLGGSPLLGAAQAAVLHPSTWLGLWLPLAPSWTFSCTFTLLLALAAAFVFFRDFGIGPTAALVGAVGWGFSTYVVFWDGWSVGPSTATFPLLLLGLRRLARGPRRNGVALTAAALCLSVFGGHPESALHGAAAGAVYFVWELWLVGRAAAGRALGAAFLAGGLALLLSAPQLLPLLETIPHSAEYRARREALAAGPTRGSVSAAEAARRLLPDLLPFAHGIYGKSAVDASRADGSGMPLGYAGAVLFPLAAAALAARRSPRGRSIFLVFLAAGLAYGGSAPVLLDATARLPGFSLALNYRLVFLAGLGLSGLAAIGIESLDEPGGPRRLAIAGAATLAVLAAASLLARPVFTERGLAAAFVRSELLAETLPVLLLAMAAAGAARRPRAIAAAAAVYLVVQRFAEMGGTYPTLPAAALAPPLPTLEAAPVGAGAPARVVAVGDALRPNAAALYGFEDARGYESIVLARVADTYPLWCRAQLASFNRVDDLARPFLDFLNVGFAVAPPDAPVPPGWEEQARGGELALFRNPRALPRAFVPRSLRPEPANFASAEVSDWGATALVTGAGALPEKNGDADVRAVEVGADLEVDANVSSRALVATSLPDWPGWAVEAPGGDVPTVTVNHAFVGFWAEPGSRAYRLRYRPRSFTLGLAAFAAGLAASAVVARIAGRRPI